MLNNLLNVSDQSKLLHPFVLPVLQMCNQLLTKVGIWLHRTTLSGPTLKYTSAPWDIWDIQIMATSVLVLQQSGVAHPPLFSNDILLFISQGNRWGKEKQTALRPKVSVVHSLLASKVRFSPAASFFSAIWRGMKAFFFFPLLLLLPLRADHQCVGTVSLVACRLRSGQIRRLISSLCLSLASYC